MMVVWMWVGMGMNWHSIGHLLLVDWKASRCPITIGIVKVIHSAWGHGDDNSNDNRSKITRKQDNEGLLIAQK